MRVAIAGSIREWETCRRTPSLFTQEARTPDGFRAFLFFCPMWACGDRAAAPFRRRSFLNKMPRGSTGTGRCMPRTNCGCSSAGRARRRQRRGRGIMPRHPLHFGCALAPPSARSRGNGRAGCAWSRAHVQREHLTGTPVTRAWTQPKWITLSCSSRRPRTPLFQGGYAGSNPAHDAIPGAGAPVAHAGGNRPQRLRGPGTRHRDPRGSLAEWSKVAAC